VIDEVKKIRQAGSRRSTDDRFRLYGPVDKLMDATAGDVSQYIAGSVPSESAYTKADRVRARFFEQLAAARRDGCDDIQVLAHSLGTVVAFNALTGYRMDEVPSTTDDVPIGISRLWTIGSPLEKFAFFFPAMTQSPALAAYRSSDRVVGVRGEVPTPSWVNFFNPLDVVAGRLRSFPQWSIENRRIWAGGMGRSHTIYETNAHVIEALSEAIFGVCRTQPISTIRRARGLVEAITECLLILAVLCLPVAAGAFVLGLLVYGVP
jgi:hypothetical protein